MKRRGSKRKCVPEPERRAVAAEIALLLKERDRLGRRVWTQASLGEQCGGLSQQMIFMARDADGVGPTVRDGILRVTGLSISELLKKHGIAAAEPIVQRAYASGANVEQAEPERQGSQSEEGLGNLRRVIRALQDDGFDAADAKLAVADLAFGDEPSFDPLSVYRRARAALEQENTRKKDLDGQDSLGKSRTRVRSVLSDIKSPMKRVGR